MCFINNSRFGQPNTMKETDKVEMVEGVNSIIPLNLWDEVLIVVVEENDAATMWAKLRALYVSKGLNNHLYILKRMFQFQFTEGTSIRAHVNEFNKTHNGFEERRRDPR